MKQPFLFGPTLGPEAIHLGVIVSTDPTGFEDKNQLVQMSAPPEGRRFNPSWGWVQFVCAFLLAGFLALLHITFHGLVAHMTFTLIVAITCGLLAGRFGDSAWKLIVTMLCFL
ncbi:MAG TPA: hypothetical protein VHB79_33615 [Polyangiaceae bacterium]|nr:hypothetical protein [Polyangiaceae bacterium]